MEFFHVLNRGVDKRDIFLEERDYVRFIHNLYEFNDRSPADSNVGHHFNSRFAPGYTDIVSPYIRERQRLVDIHGWCLMKNHYHFLLSERVEGGISLFLRKVNIGYAKYFNEKNNRTGTLFEGRSKKIRIGTDSHFNYILHYIHLNPLDYLEGANDWRLRSKGVIRNVREALNYLDTYRWSSYLDYAGKRNFPSLLTSSFFKGSRSYHADLVSYLRDTEDDSTTVLRLE